MRIRQVKPSFWTDPVTSELPDAVRLFYIGLWMIADDAGWFRLDVAEIGRDLYGYEPRKTREKRVVAMLDQLEDAGRIVRHACGHAEVPTLTDHQRFASATKQVRTFANEHLKACVAPATRDVPRIPAGVDDIPRIPGPVTGTEMLRNVTVRKGSVSARPRRGALTDDGTTSEFQRRVPRELAIGADA